MSNGRISVIFDTHTKIQGDPKTADFSTRLHVDASVKDKTDFYYD